MARRDSDMTEEERVRYWQNSSDFLESNGPVFNPTTLGGYNDKQSRVAGDGW